VTRRQVATRTRRVGACSFRRRTPPDRFPDAPLAHSRRDMSRIARHVARAGEVRQRRHRGVPHSPSLSHLGRLNRPDGPTGYGSSVKTNERSNRRTMSMSTHPHLDHRGPGWLRSCSWPWRARPAVRVAAHRRPERGAQQAAAPAVAPPTRDEIPLAPPAYEAPCPKACEPCSAPRSPATSTRWCPAADPRGGDLQPRTFYLSRTRACSAAWLTSTRRPSETG